MRVLLITGYFPPENAAAPNLNYELARELVRMGHSVTVATGFPRYNLKEVPRQYRYKLRMRESMNGVKVIRTWYPPMPRHNRFARGMDILLMPFALLASAFSAGRQDVATVFSPPMTVGFTGIAASWIYGYKFIYNVHDLFPQNAVDAGVLRSRILIGWLASMARFIYRKATYITVISPTNRENVIAEGGRSDRTVVIPDWVDTELVGVDVRRNSFSAKYGLDEKFVVSFSGVMGFTQDLDVVLDAASRLADHPSIHFLLVGDGVDKPRLEAKATQMRLQNVTFVGMIPHSEVRAVFHSSDVCLATLRSTVKTSPVPSKIMWSMAAARPVITCLDLRGDAPKLLLEADCGIALPPGDPDALAQAILRLASDSTECKRLGDNGRAFVLKHLTVQSAAAKLCELLECAVADTQGVAEQRCQ